MRDGGYPTCKFQSKRATAWSHRTSCACDGRQGRLISEEVALVSSAREEKEHLAGEFVQSPHRQPKFSPVAFPELRSVIFAIFASAQAGTWSENHVRSTFVIDVS